MDQMAIRRLRISAIALLVAFFTCGVCRVGAAETYERILRKARLAVGNAGTVASQPISHEAGPGRLRYYGGPKGPMWREP